MPDAVLKQVGKQRHAGGFVKKTAAFAGTQMAVRGKLPERDLVRVMSVQVKEDFLQPQVLRRTDDLSAPVSEP